LGAGREVLLYPIASNVGQKKRQVKRKRSFKTWNRYRDGEKERSEGEMDVALQWDPLVSTVSPNRLSSRGERNGVVGEYVTIW